MQSADMPHERYDITGRSHRRSDICGHSRSRGRSRRCLPPSPSPSPPPPAPPPSLPHGHHRSRHPDTGTARRPSSPATTAVAGRGSAVMAQTRASPRTAHRTGMATRGMQGALLRNPADRPPSQGRRCRTARGSRSCTAMYRCTRSACGRSRLCGPLHDNLQGQLARKVSRLLTFMLHCSSVEHRVAEGDGEHPVLPKAGVDRSALGRVRHVTEDILLTGETLHGVSCNALTDGHWRRRMPCDCAMLRMPVLPSLAC